MALNPRITQWRGQQVWLLGASTGIGRATASRLHALGASVTVSARSQAGLDSFVASHAGARALALDSTDAAAVQHATNTLLQRHGRIDLALYCAGHYNAMQASTFDLADALRHSRSTTWVHSTCWALCCRCYCARLRLAARPTSAWWAAWPVTVACPTRWPTAPPRPR